MATTTTPRRHHTRQKKHPKNYNCTAIDHAVRLIHAVCGLAGSPTWIDDIRADLAAENVRTAIRHGETAAVFDWLLATLSYQGISDQVAEQYMTRHGRIRWHAIDAEVRENPSCPKLKNY